MNGTIIKAMSGFYYIETAGEVFQTRARGNFRDRGIKPLVGDDVEFEPNGLIMAINERRNELIRPSIANVDQAVVVASVAEPKLSLNLLDRMISVLEYHNIKPILYFSKLDLLPDEDLDETQNIFEYYERIGYAVINNLNLEPLKPLFKNNVTVFTGQTGAGKSTLLNELDTTLDLKTDAISDKLGRGKHTTRHVELHHVFDGLIADTPGFSAVDLTQIDSVVSLRETFVEMRELQGECKFRECTHTHEPGCAVKASLEEGFILESRYDDYLQFIEEIENRREEYIKKAKKG
ncbi:MAG: ribosome small subunit-dependent GTPase A [Lactobacillales bacterium]|jgi:ribosome biogenesis GTPase|nr:ribosome small subunit-dependent GTPase A [Lactobacillales bacterium]